MVNIYKYILNVADIQTIVVPKGSTLLTVQKQQARMAVWYLIDTEELLTDVWTFFVCGTGNPVEDHRVCKKNYISTVQLYDGDLVYHIFAEKQ